MTLTMTCWRAPLPAAALCLALSAFAFAPGAFASGGSGSGGDQGTSQGGAASGQGQSHSDMTTCQRGKVWDAKARKCLPQHSGVLPDDELADYAFALAKAERYQDAIDILDLSQDPNTAKALNYRGYATRKLGRTEEGIGYYLQSVALDPRYAQVREYLGEAYVIQGKYDLAKEQLSIIKTICGSNSCDEYDDLERALVYAHGL